MTNRSSRSLWTLVPALALTAAGPAIFMLGLDVPAVRSSALLLATISLAGAALTLWLAVTGRGWLRPIAALVAVAVSGIFLYGVTVMTAIPESGRVAAAASVAPDFTLKDARGAMHTLADIVTSEPTVLVFYRGGW